VATQLQFNSYIVPQRPAKRMSLVTPNYRNNKHDLQFAKIITETLAVFMKYFDIKTVKTRVFSHGKTTKNKNG
jgi:hypothetical protein